MALQSSVRSLQQPGAVITARGWTGTPKGRAAGVENSVCYLLGGCDGNAGAPGTGIPCKLQSWLCSAPPPLAPGVSSSELDNEICEAPASLYLVSTTAGRGLLLPNSSKTALVGFQSLRLGMEAGDGV